MDKKLLEKVRRQVLIWAALESRYFGLSSLERMLDENRGHIQRCLSLLAKDGVMYERQHPEPYVAPYEHCETDKRFHIRISKEDAIEQLKEMGVKDYGPKEEYRI